MRRRGGGGNMRDYCVDEILCDIFAVKPHTEETMKKHFSIFDKITEEFLGVAKLLTCSSQPTNQPGS